jgi:hypothetical protein
MKVYCTRPGCPRPDNYASDLDNEKTRREVQQKFCTTCGMPLILDGRYLPEELLGKGGFWNSLTGLRSPYPQFTKMCGQTVHATIGSYPSAVKAGSNPV